MLSTEYRKSEPCTLAGMRSPFVVLLLQAAQEQLVSAHNSTLAEMNQRLNSQKDRYNELTKVWASLVLFLPLGAR